MNINIDKTRFLMVDRIVKHKGKYLIYIFGYFGMSEQLKDRKNNEYFCIKQIFNDARVIGVKQNKLNDFFSITDTDGHKYKKTFIEYQKIFNKENNSSNLTPSKRLGIRKESSDDKFITSFLTKITGDNFIGDDEGVDITEKLLGQNSTHGFDLDVFDSKSRIVYEFLRRKNSKINNLTAHPMRYAWNNNSKPDNRRKFIALWKFCQHFNLKLFLVSYSTEDQSDNDIIKLIIPDLIDDNKGILSDNEYYLKREDLFSLAKDPNPVQFLKNNSFPSIHLNAQEFSSGNFKFKLQEWSTSLLQNHQYY